MAYSEAKKLSNKKSDAKYSQILLKPYKEEALRIKGYAAAAHMSTQGYILQAVRKQMEADSKIGKMDTTVLDLDNIEVPDLFNADGQKVELNYHEMCSLLVAALKDDPNLNDEQRKSILATVFQLHDLLIDLSW